MENSMLKLILICINNKPTKSLIYKKRYGISASFCVYYNSLGFYHFLSCSCSDPPATIIDVDLNVAASPAPSNLILDAAFLFSIFFLFT